MMSMILGAQIVHTSERKTMFYDNAMMKQAILYASNVWSACSTGNLQRVFPLQKRSARVILDVDTRANSGELFTRLDWLPLPLEVKLNICVQGFTNVLMGVAQAMSDLLVLNSDINERNNKNSSLNLVCPRFKHETELGGGGRTFGLRATRLWNAVPNPLKKNECVHSFKKALIDFLDFYASS